MRFQKQPRDAVTPLQYEVIGHVSAAALFDVDPLPSFSLSTVLPRAAPSRAQRGQQPLCNGTPQERQTELHASR